MDGMMTKRNTYQWGYLPEVLFSLVILASQVPPEDPKDKKKNKSCCDPKQDCLVLKAYLLTFSEFSLQHTNASTA